MSDDMEWHQTETGSWMASGPRWGYELIHYVNPQWPDTKDAYLMRITQVGTGESQEVGAYQTLEGAKQYAQRYEDNPSAWFKSQWWGQVMDDEREDPNYG